MKRINPNTGTHYRRGELREDGHVFLTYVKTITLSSGFFKEKWLSPIAASRQYKSQKDCGNVIKAALHIKRREYLNGIKMASGCVDCGYRESPVALDFDHVNPQEKSFTVSTRYLNTSWKKLKNEVSKCVVRCANCHRVKTNGAGESQ